jgi:putative two-component system response regulator
VNTSPLLQRLRSALTLPSQSHLGLIDEASASLVGVTQSAVTEAHFACALELARLCSLTEHARLSLDATSHCADLAAGTGNAPQHRVMLTLLGSLQGQTGNVGGALESFSAALDVCEATRNPKDFALTWLNLSALLIGCQLSELATSALQVALQSAGETTDLNTRNHVESAVYANLTVAALQTGRYSHGLLAGRKALHFNRRFERHSSSAFSVAFQSATLLGFGNLLLRINDLETARSCVERAQVLRGSTLLTPRASWSIEALHGLFEAYSGQTDAGIERIAVCWNDAARSHPSFEGLLIRALIEAAEVSGRLDDSNQYRMELAAFLRRVGGDNAQFHHRRHMQRIATSIAPESAPSTSPTNGMAGRIAAAPMRTRREIKVLEDLGVIAELHDDSSGQHPFRVAKLTRLLAEAIGQSREYCARISVAAQLHDVGKTGTPSEILRKRGSLSQPERRLMQQHAAVGAELIESSGIQGLGLAIEVARHHHECWDGSGYPGGLLGHDIPLGARIVAITECFDALTHDRAYRPRMSVRRALDVIAERSGRSFDPVLVSRFIPLIGRLQCEHADLDSFLARDAMATSTVLRAQHDTLLRLNRATDPEI